MEISLYSLFNTCISYQCCITDDKFSVLFAFIISQFPWVREFGPELAGFSASGFQWVAIHVWPGLRSHQRLNWGRICFRAHSSCWQSPYSCRTKAATAPRGLLWFLIMWILLRGSLIPYCQPGRKKLKSKSASKMESYNVITLYPCAIFYW